MTLPVRPKRGWAASIAPPFAVEAGTSGLGPQAMTTSPQNPHSTRPRSPPQNPHEHIGTSRHITARCYWLDCGGAEGDLMELNGWSSPQMLTRYGASARAARARRNYDRVMNHALWP